MPITPDQAKDTIEQEKNKLPQLDHIVQINFRNRVDEILSKISSKSGTIPAALEKEVLGIK